jgi:hypothetical protein
VQRLPRGILPNLVGEHVRGRLDGGIALQRITGWWSNRARATRPSRQVADKADAKNR